MGAIEGLPPRLLGAITSTSGFLPLSIDTSFCLPLCPNDARLWCFFQPSEIDFGPEVSSLDCICQSFDNTCF